MENVLSPVVALSFVGIVCAAEAPKKQAAPAAK